MKTPRISGQRGFTLPAVMGIMLVASLICVAAFQAANGDVHGSAKDSRRKQAYAAAESGISWYLAKLNADPNYWEDCDTGTTDGIADPVNQSTVVDASRKWQTVAVSGTGTAKFSLAVMPAPSHPNCDINDPASMIRSDGSFVIRSTGTYRGETRSIMTSFQRRRFLDFVEFFDYMTLDPATAPFFGYDGSQCERYHAAGRPGFCDNVYYGTGESVRGPLHTNDSLGYCGSPSFGRNTNDNVTVSGPDPGTFYVNCGEGGSPTFSGVFRYAQRALQMPPTNAALKALTTPGTSGQGYLLTGTTYIRLNGDAMTIDTPGTGPGHDPYTAPLPENGVLYVQTDNSQGCTNLTYGDGHAVNPVLENYQEGPGCGNLYVSGHPSHSITLAAERDIIVAPTLDASAGTQFNPQAPSSSSDADLTAGTMDSSTRQISGSTQIGLIANNYIRVYHPVDGWDYYNSHDTSPVRDVRIDAACISLQHSFFVDNFFWGDHHNKRLRLQGSVTQRFTGVHEASTGTGMVQDYVYDDRLRYRTPPHFIDPVNAAWGVGRETELIPAV